MDKYLGTSFFSFLGLDYVLSIYQDRLIIFSTEVIDEVQTIRNLRSNIVGAVGCAQGRVVLLLQDSAVVMAPQLQTGGQIIWKRQCQQELVADLTWGCVDQQANHLLLGDASNVLRVYKMEMDRQGGVTSLSEKSAYQSQRRLQGGWVSADDTQLVLQSDSELMIYKLQSLLDSAQGQQQFIEYVSQQEQGAEYQQLEKFNQQGAHKKRAAVERHIEYEGESIPLEGLPCCVLSHGTPIQSVNLRQTRGRHPLIRAPISILTIDSNNMLRVYQENTYSIDDSLYYFQVFSLQVSTGSGQVGVCWLDQKSHFKEKKESPAYFKPAYNINWGVYDNQALSADYFLVQNKGLTQIYLMEGLRNQAARQSATLVLTLKNIENIHKILNSYFYKAQNCFYLEAIVEDRRKCLLKVHLDLQNSEAIQVHHNNKYRLGDIELISFDRKKESFCILNGINEVVIQNYQTLDCFPEEYNKEAQQKRQLYQLKQPIIQQQAHVMFHSKNLVVFFNSLADTLYILMLQGDRHSIFQCEYSYKVQQDMAKAFINRKSNKQQIKMVQESQRVNLIKMSFVIIKDTEMAIINYVFLTKRMQEHVNLMRLKDSSFIAEENVLQLPEECLLVDEVVVHELPSPYDRLRLQKNSQYNYKYDILLLKGTQLQHYSFDESFSLLRQVPLESTATHIALTQKLFPCILFCILDNNDVAFYKEGQLMTTYKMSSLFKEVEQQKISIRDLRVLVKHLQDYTFALMVNNYLVVISLVFDKKQQRFQAETVSRTNDYGMLHRRFTACTSAFGLFISEQDNIYVQTRNQVKPVKNNLDYLLFNLKSTSYAPDNLNMKLLSRSKSALPHHHPDLLQELLLMADFSALDTIFRHVADQLSYKGSLTNQFFLSLSELNNVPSPEENNEFWETLLARPDKKVPLSYGLYEEWEPLQSLGQLLRRPQVKLGLYPQDQMAMVDCLECLVQFKQHSRSLDLPAALFMYFVKKWAKKTRGKSAAASALLTKEVVWAIHTQHQDHLMQELVLQQGLDSLQWNTMRQYCVPLWYDDLAALKKCVEAIAKNIYKENKDPTKVALYYILLGKHSLLAMLFKQQATPAAGKIADFLKNDFTQERWITAARKNAYALLGRKDYIQSTAFFLMGGHCMEAIDVVMQHFQDVQLALLIAKLLKRNDLLNNIYQDQFVEQSDQWAQHIGLWQQGKRVDSLNVLATPSIQSQMSMQLSQSLALSSFHPNSLILVQQLRHTVPVKRELQEGAQLQDNYIYHLMASLEYFIAIDNPILGLHWYQKVQRDTPIKDPSLEKLLKVLIHKFIRCLLLRAYSQEDWKQCFTKLNEDLVQLSPFHWLLDESEVQYILKKEVQMSQSLKYQVAYQLYQEQSDQVVPLLERFSSRLNYMLQYLSRSSPLRHFEQSFWLNMLYGIEEMNQCIWLIIDSRVCLDDEQSLQDQQKMAYLALFMISNALQLYSHQLTLLKLVANFSTCPQLRDDRTELQSISKAIKEHVLEYVYQYKYKSNKSSKYVDLLQDAFPTNPYQLPHNIHKYTFTHKTIPKKHLLLSHCLNLIFLENFSRFVSPCPVVVQECLQHGHHRQMKACFSLTNLFSPDETVQTIQSIAQLLSLDQEQGKQSILNTFFTQISLETIEELSMKLQCQESIDTLLLKSLGRMSKTMSMTTSVEEIISRYLPDNIQLWHTHLHLRAFCHDQKLNNNALVVLTNKGLQRVNVQQCLLQNESGHSYSCSLSQQQQSTLAQSLSYSLLSQHSASKISSLTQLFSHRDQSFTEMECVSDSMLLASSPSDSLLITTGKGKLSLIDMMSFETVQTLTTQQDALVVVVKFSPQGDRVGCVDSQGVFYLFRVSRQHKPCLPLLTLNSPRQIVLDFAFTNNSSMFATVGQSPKPFLIIQDVLLPSPGVVQQECVGGNLVCFSSIYQLLVIANLKRNSIYCYSVDKQTILRTFEYCLQSEVRLMLMSKNETHLVSAHQDGSHRIIDLYRLDVLREIKGKIDSKKKSIMTVWLHQVGYSVLAGSSDGTLNILVPSLL